MKLILAVAITLAGLSSFANEEGVIIEGKEHIIFKDGKKVGDVPAVSTENKGGRGPASIKSTSWMSIGFTKDTANKVICYYDYSSAVERRTVGLSCVKY